MVPVCCMPKYLLVMLREMESSLRKCSATYIHILLSWSEMTGEEGAMLTEKWEAAVKSNQGH